jgi:hypothetical protein
MSTEEDITNCQKDINIDNLNEVILVTVPVLLMLLVSFIIVLFIFVVIEAQRIKNKISLTRDYSFDKNVLLKSRKVQENLNEFYNNFPEELDISKETETRRRASFASYSTYAIKETRTDSEVASTMFGLLLNPLDIRKLSFNKSPNSDLLKTLGTLETNYTEDKNRNITSLDVFSYILR